MVEGTRSEREEKKKKMRKMERRGEIFMCICFEGIGGICRAENKSISKDATAGKAIAGFSTTIAATVSTTTATATPLAHRPSPRQQFRN